MISITKYLAGRRAASAGRAFVKIGRRCVSGSPYEKPECGKSGLLRVRSSQPKHRAKLLKTSGCGITFHPLNHWSYSGLRYLCTDSRINFRKTKLVIFDKDGTLVDYGSGWTRWSVEKANEFEERVNIDGLAERLLTLWGYNLKEDKWGDGLLCETEGIIKEQMYEFFISEGISQEVATELQQIPIYATPERVDAIDNPKLLCEQLKGLGIKVGVCTTDSRASCMKMLASIGIADLVDSVVCGDDPGGKPKPDPQSIYTVCREVGVDPELAIMVGDTKRDIDMGKSAGVLGTMSVASGVGTPEELAGADVKLISVKDILKTITSPNPEYTAGNQSTTPQRRNFSTFIHASRRYTYSRSIHASQRGYSSVAYNSEHDYVIVGAGSAGCVLANRLSADADTDVFLLEAGGKDRSWKFHMPAALMYTLTNPRYNWCYYTTPQRHADDRVMYWPRGKVWGGSSSHNAMVYIRGHAADYDRWEAEGAAGWSYTDCLPYFRKAQTHELGEDDYRGGDGPLYVSRGTSQNPLHDAFIEAGVQAGYPRTEDCNGYQQEGFGPFEMTIKDGKRASTSVRYLKPVLKRGNLSAETRTLVRRVMFEGSRAVGVEYERGGQVRRVRARREVILSAGAINTPQLLMLSGVGNADHLSEHGIPVVRHLPGVGENLQDHLEVYMQYTCKEPITLYKYQWKFPLTMIRTGVEWFLWQTGNAATTHMESGAFIRSRPGVPHPDIQYHFLPSVVIDHGQKMGLCHAYQAHVGPMRPTSRGTLRLKSADPGEYPLMDPNYLGTEEDRQDFRDCVTHTREILAQPAFDRYRGEELLPGADCQSPAQVDAFVRAKSDSAYHPSCTCKMGRETDPLAVVDPECRVYGVEGLRVVDASVMPSLVSGNLNGPVIMIAEKAADVIRGQTPLPKSPAPVWQPQSLSTQRGF